MKPKKKKKQQKKIQFVANCKQPVNMDAQCRCGHKWTAAWPTGKITRQVKCPSCLNFLRIDGKPGGTGINDRKFCAGCHRPMLNDHHCTYCGRPA